MNLEIWFSQSRYKLYSVQTHEIAGTSWMCHCSRWSWSIKYVSHQTLWGYHSYWLLLFNSIWMACCWARELAFHGGPWVFKVLVICFFAHVAFDPEWLDFPTLQEQEATVLEKNYRSTGSILALGHSIILQGTYSVPSLSCFVHTISSRSNSQCEETGGHSALWSLASEENEANFNRFRWLTKLGRFLCAA